MWWTWTWFGMNFLWWIFWVLLVVAIFAFFPPMPRGQVTRRLTPLEILQRRYAAGELTTAEYEERRQRLLQDRDLGERREPPASAAPQPQ